LLVDLLKSLGELYDSEFHTPQFSVALKTALGAAVSAMGPEKFLSVLPINLDRLEYVVAELITYQLSAPDCRLWILPLFKQRITNTEMQYFTKYFLPLSTQLQQRIQKEQETGSAVAAKNFTILYYQIWDLFPSFATYPTDVTTSFKGLAKTLGNMLTSDENLRKCICEGLINLIEKNRSVASSDGSESQVEFPISPQQAKQNLAAIAVFSKNFLPILFNIYSVVPAEEIGTVHRAIESFVSISEASVRIWTLKHLYLFRL
jgi:ribosomal RNA-processing protein 12